MNSEPESLGPANTERDRPIDQLRPVIHHVFFEQAATWDRVFPGGNTSTVIGVPDAVTFAAQAVVDAGWRP